MNFKRLSIRNKYIYIGMLIKIIFDHLASAWLIPILTKKRCQYFRGLPGDLQSTVLYTEQWSINIRLTWERTKSKPLLRRLHLEKKHLFVYWRIQKWRSTSLLASSNISQKPIIMYWYMYTTLSDETHGTQVKTTHILYIAMLSVSFYYV